jgi:hypothetical protein
MALSKKDFGGIVIDLHKHIWLKMPDLKEASKLARHFMRKGYCFAHFNRLDAVFLVITAAIDLKKDLPKGSIYEIVND